MCAPEDVTILERDPDEVASDLSVEASVRAHRNADYELATMLSEASAWIEELTDRVHRLEHPAPPRFKTTLPGGFELNLERKAALELYWKLDAEFECPAHRDQCRDARCETRDRWEKAGIYDPPKKD